MKQSNDEHTKNELELIPEENKQVSKRKQTSKKAFPFLGGLLGGAISSIIILLLFTNQFTSLNNTEAEINGDQFSQLGEPIENVATINDNDSLNIEKVSEAVVGISNLQQQDIWKSNEETGSGSGIIYKKEDGKAYVITNNHVVQGANQVIVNLNDEEQVDATVLGTDPLSDLAVLEIDGSKIDMVAELGLSEELNVGETVFAIGNPISMDFSGSVTKGIISGLNRPVKVDTTGNNQADWVTEVIQTDAAINPGNSGGALVNTAGKVVGINSMKIASQTIEGIGFAIPIDSALPIIEQLEKNGEVSRPYIGISMVELSQVPEEYKHKISVPENEQSGIVIANIEANSPADEAGLQQFDVITKINNTEIASVLDLRKYMYSEMSVDTPVQITVYRDGKKLTNELKLVKRPN